MFYDKLILLCEKKGISPTKLTGEIGVGASNATRWKSGSAPRKDTIKKIADYFKVSTNYFYDKKENSITTANVTHTNIVQGNHTNVPNLLDFNLL